MSKIDREKLVECLDYFLTITGVWLLCSLAVFCVVFIPNKVNNRMFNRGD